MEISGRTPPAVRAMTVSEKREYESWITEAAQASASNRAADEISLYRRLLSREEETFGPAHPEILGTLQRIGNLLVDAADYGAAEPIFRRQLGLSTHLLGERHPNTLVSLTNLAFTLRNQGRLAEAEPLNRQAVTSKIAVLGEKDPATLVSLSNLASNLNGLGRGEEAELLNRKALALRTEVLGEKHPDTLSSISNLASNLNTLGRFTEAEHLNRQALTLKIEVLGQKHPATLVSLSNLAYSLSVLGRPAEAEPLLREVLTLRIEVLGEAHPATINSLAAVATNLMELGRFREAEPLNRKALALLTKALGEQHPDTLNCLNNLAVNLRILGQVEESVVINRKILAVHTELSGEKHPDTLMSMRNLALDLGQSGRTAEAEALNRKALAILIETRGEKHPDTLTIQGNLAANLAELGRPAEAEPLDRQVLAYKTEVLGEKHPLTIASLQYLSLSQLEQPSRAYLAISSIRRAVSAIRSQRADSPSDVRGETQASREAVSGRSYLTTLADAAWSAGPGLSPESLATGAGRPDAASLASLRLEAFGALQDAMAGSASQAVALQAARAAADRAGTGLGDLARERQQLSDEWRNNEQEQTAKLSGSDADASLKRDALRQQADAIEARLSAIDARLQREAPDYYNFTRHEALSLVAAQDVLSRDEAVLMVVPTQFGTHVMVVSRDGITWNRADLKAADVQKMVSTLRADLDPSHAATRGVIFTNSAVRGRAGSYDRKTAFALYDKLIAPVAAALAGKSEVFVAASDDLASLPFGVLVTQVPQGDDGDLRALRDTSWFADAHALTQIPSLQSLAFLRTQRDSKRRTPGTRANVRLTGFGNPVLAGGAMTRGATGRGMPTMAEIMVPGRTRDGGPIADITKLRDLPSLPGTDRELRNLATALGAPLSALHLQAEDTEAAARAADLSKSTIIAFATHGLVAGEGGAAEPALVFTPPDTASDGDDGLLTASEITTMRLDADWVILSACNTAAGSGRGEPGLSGLARAFFFAGARSLVASHWPVRDDIAAQLIVETIRTQQVDSNLSKAGALTSAMRAIRNDTKDLSRAHPSAWAPFSIIGENR